MDISHASTSVCESLVHQEFDVTDFLLSSKIEKQSNETPSFAHKFSVKTECPRDIENQGYQSLQISNQEKMLSQFIHPIIDQ